MYKAVHYGYNIYVDDGIQGAFTKIEVDDTSAITYPVGNLSVGLPYRFKVSVVSEVGESDHSPVSTFYPGDLPVAPTAPKYINSSLTSITVEWQSGDASLSQSGGNDYLNWQFQASYFQNLTELDAQVGVDWDSGLTQIVPFQVGQNQYQLEVICDNVTAGVSLQAEFIYFRVAATTNVGLGAYSAESRVRCAPAPEAPILYEPFTGSLQSSSAGSVVAWYEQNLFQATLLGFEVHANDGLGSDVVLVKSILDSSIRAFKYAPPAGTTVGYVGGETIVHDGVMLLTTATSTTTTIENRPIRFKVAVITDVTTGPLSEELTVYSCAPPVLTAVKPYVAAGVYNLTGNGLYSLTLGWTPPADTGGCTIVGYRIEKDSTYERLPDTSVVNHGDANFTLLDPLLSSASGNFTDVYPTDPGPDPNVVPPYVAYADGNDTVYANYTQYGNLDPTIFTATYVDAGITKGNVYRFRVIVVTRKGDYPGPVTDVQVSAVPSKMLPPVANYELSTTTSLYVTWQVPENNGGIVRGYTLYRNEGNGTAVSEVSDPTCGRETTPAPQQCTITDLTPGAEYQIQMATVNEVGEGMRSDPTIFVAAKVPGSPQDLTISAADDGALTLTPSLTLTWRSGTDEGAMIFDYILAVKEVGVDNVVEYISMGGTEQASWNLVNAPTKTLTAAAFSTLPWEVGRHYQVKVQGVNLVGQGAWGQFTDPQKTELGVTLNNGVILSAPSKVSGFQRHTDQQGVPNDTIKMQWTKLSTTTQFGGDVAENITYHVFGDRVSGSSDILLHSQSHLVASEWEHTGSHPTYPVSPGQAWYYTVRAGNGGGFLSEPVLPPVKMIAAFVPGVPRDFTAANTVNAFQTLLNWNPPADDGGNSLVFYRIRSSQGVAWTADVSATLLFHQYSGQQAVATTYYISAGNSIGFGAEATFALTVNGGR
ncbi:unnamed protein product [Amoebophrya sp. A120]|nr:unnamed protein product [Amoebophrya sp. A120]|eukprot:GSA120T00017440001.1